MKKVSVCIPVLAIDYESIHEQLTMINYDSIDLVEIRLDYYVFIDDFHQLDALFNSINVAIKKPYIVTLRSVNEGGKYVGDIQSYISIYQYILTKYTFYALDIELQYAKEAQEIITLAHDKNIQCIISYHNFDNTPSLLSLINVYSNMLLIPNAIYKIAVMIHNNSELVRLLNFSQQLNYQHQHIIIGMGQSGLITRVMPQLFHSMITFGSVSQSSAPGQLHINQLSEILNILSNN